MIEAPPRIDPRNQEILVKELRKLLLNYCPEWNDASIGTDKRANAMLYIFSRMMETIIQRLNKVPEKNFMTFLDLMGVRMSPPRIARAALTFKMVAGAKQYGSIPAGSQVATEKTKEEDSTVFETENDLTAILPGISRAVSISPVDDSFEEHSAFLFSNEKKEVELFKGKKLIPHRLYIGHNELFALKEISDITLTIAIVDDIKEKKINYNYKIPDEWEVKWYYFDENSNPAPLIPESNDPFITNLLKSGPIIFKNAVGISEKTLDGIYLFNWDKIPGNDNDRLLEFLRQKFYIDTAMTAKIEKINGGNVIRIITERNRISLKLGIDKIKVSIEIDDGRTDELMAKIENICGIEFANT
jgi:hypothetical protein